MLKECGGQGHAHFSPASASTPAQGLRIGVDLVARDHAPGWSARLPVWSEVWSLKVKTCAFLYQFKWWNPVSFQWRFLWGDMSHISCYHIISLGWARDQIDKGGGSGEVFLALDPNSAQECGFVQTGQYDGIQYPRYTPGICFPNGTTFGAFFWKLLFHYPMVYIQKIYESRSHGGLPSPNHARIHQDLTPPISFRPISLRFYLGLQTNVRSLALSTWVRLCYRWGVQLGSNWNWASGYSSDGVGLGTEVFGHPSQTDISSLIFRWKRNGFYIPKWQL